MRLKHLCRSRFPFLPANILKTTYKKMAATVIHPKMIPKWILPASNWNNPKETIKRNGPERSASSCKSGLTRKGLRMESVLLQICLVLIPSSSRRGGSSSKLRLPPEMRSEKVGAAEKCGGTEAAAAETSNDMKGMLGFAGKGAEEEGARRCWGVGPGLAPGKTTGGTLNSFDIAADRNQDQDAPNGGGDGETFFGKQLKLGHQPGNH